MTLPQHYSTEEQVVGKWIDGKTLYRKSFTLPKVDLNGSTTISLPSGAGFVGVDSCGSYCVIDIHRATIPRVYYNNATTNIDIVEQNGAITIRCGAEAKFDSGVLTVMYTKDN